MSGPIAYTVRVVIPLQAAEDRKLENRQAIALWLARALSKRFDAGTYDVGHRPDQGLTLEATFAPVPPAAGALTAAAGVLELVDQALELGLMDTRPPRARHALERLFAGLRRATVSVTPRPIPKGPQA